MTTTELDISLFSLLRQEFGDSIPIMRCTKATLVHLSHSLEDLVLREQLPALLFTGFQESSHWREETERYRALAEVAQQVCIFAGGTLPPESDARQLHITLSGDDPLRQEWFLAILSTQFSVLLCGQDRAVPVIEEATRQFDTIWSFEPQVVDRVLDLLEKVIAHYRPERLALLQEARRTYPAIAPSPGLMTTLTAEMIRFEEQLHTRLREAKIEADRANRAKSEFLSRMSHELRTPLNAILGFAQVLELDLPPTPEQRESVQYILKGGRHLLELINEVLDISRIEAGRLKLNIEPFSVREALDETISLVRPLAAARAIQIVDTFPAESEFRVCVDQQRLKQVLLNFLSNAVKYNREAGRITVAVEEVGTERLRVAISDTGSGITSEDMERLFRPFERLRADTTGVEGTGIGLAISKGLVEAMGGKVGVSSTLDEGSTFWLELPRDLAQPQATLEEEMPVQSRSEDLSRTFTVLYIEDDMSNFRLIERILSHRASLRIMNAMQARPGIEYAREHQPDLILLDVNLPDLPGYEVVRRLQEEPRTAQIPLIIISADATQRQIEHFMSAGARAYLTKPLDVQQFLEVVDTVLGPQ